MTSSSFLSVPQSGRCPWMAASNLLPHRMVRLIRPGSCKSFFFLRWDIQDSDACPLWLYQGMVMPLETATRQPPNLDLHTAGHWCSRWPCPVLISSLLSQLPPTLHCSLSCCLPSLCPCCSFLTTTCLDVLQHCPFLHGLCMQPIWFVCNSSVTFREVRSTRLSAVLQWNKAVSPEVASDTKAPYSLIPHLSSDSL